MSEEWFVIRDPIHGFIKLTELEKKIIDSPEFQRLRRISQLSWTNMVYPSSNHTRFEHSIGVMHLADKMYSTIWAKSAELLKEHNISIEDRDRYRIIIRLAALLHDIGHGPFSHSSDVFFPEKEEGKKWKHEDYSISIIQNLMAEVIESDKSISDFSITINEITELITGGSPYNPILFWKQLIASQLDSDRMDYLLRDSYFTGKKYGVFDIDRVIESINIGENPEDGHLLICIEEGGKESAVALIIARYFAYQQIYFHKLRRGFDTFLKEIIKMALDGNQYPSPEKESIKEYMKWDDWKLKNYIYNMPDCPIRNVFINRKKPHILLSTEDESENKRKLELLKGHDGFYPDVVSNDWYSIDKNIFVKGKKPNELEILSGTSPLIDSLNTTHTYYIYCLEEDEGRLSKILEEDVQ